MTNVCGENRIESLKYLWVLGFGLLFKTRGAGQDPPKGVPPLGESTELKKKPAQVTSPLPLCHPGAHPSPSCKEATLLAGRAPSLPCALPARLQTARMRCTPCVGGGDLNTGVGEVRLIIHMNDQILLRTLSRRKKNCLLNSKFQADYSACVSI